MRLTYPLMPAFTGALLLFSACTFDPSGLGTEGETAPGSSSGDASTSTGEPLDPTTGVGSTTGGEETTGPETTTTGVTCADGCPPTVGWTRIGEHGEGVGAALVVDAFGDVVVAGDKMQGTDPTLRNIWTGKFRGETGAPVWEMGRGGNAKRDDFARAITLDVDGTVVVAGSLHETDKGKADVWVAWLAPGSGDVNAESNLGTTDWDDGDAELDEWARAVAFHPNGDLLVAGDRCVRPCEVPDAWVGRYTATGEVVWDLPMLPFGPGAVRGLVAKDEGLVFVGTDGHANSMSPWRSRIRQLNATGGGTWSALPESGFEEDSYEALAVALSPDGLLWVVGRTFLAEEPAGGFIRVYDPAVDVMPVAELAGEDLNGSAWSVAVIDGGALVGGAVGERLWFARYDPTLAEVWRIEAEAGPDMPFVARGLAVDSAGDTLVLGAIAPKSRNEGERLWLRKYVAAGP